MFSEAGCVSERQRGRTVVGKNSIGVYAQTVILVNSTPVNFLILFVIT